MRSLPKKTRYVHARIEAAPETKLKAIAQREGLDLSDIVRRAIREFLERQAASANGN